ncbi:hypothetical protein ACLB2K_066569 [Fragaria x ananassa]
MIMSRGGKRAAKHEHDTFKSSPARLKLVDGPARPKQHETGPTWPVHGLGSIQPKHGPPRYGLEPWVGPGLTFEGFDTFASQSLSRSQFNLEGRMGEVRDNDGYEEELVDYDEEEQNAPNSVSGKPNGESAKKGYVGIHSSGFRDFLLKPELLRAIVNSGFEHPSEVQHECIPQAILGMDVLCQAKSGMGKTAVFVLSTLQQIEPVAGQVAALILCHTRELAYQICHEFERFSTYLPELKVAVFYGGVSIKVHRDLLKNECPHIVVGTPGRVLALARDKELGLKNVRHFILDECDKMLESLDMRRDVQMIFKLTPHDKQVMMFSATLSKEIRPVCKKFMQDPMEIYVDDEAKLTLHGLVQHYIKLSESEKNRKLTDLLDALDFNQVVIFVKSVSRAAELNKLLADCNFPSICIHSGMPQEERLKRYKNFKEGLSRILVATDLVGRGIDIERVNIVINYDMPDSADTYLHRVGRAGRFGTKGLAITFVSSSADSDVLNQCKYDLLLKDGGLWILWLLLVLVNSEYHFPSICSRVYENLYACDISNSKYFCSKNDYCFVIPYIR